MNRQDIHDEANGRSFSISTHAQTRQGYLIKQWKGHVKLLFQE